MHPTFSTQAKGWRMANAIRLVLTGLGIGIMAVWLTPATTGAAASELEGYNQRIDQRKHEIEKIKKRIVTYEKRITETRQQAVNLRNQIALAENEIAKKELDIELTKKHIATTNLEIQRTHQEILTQTDRIVSHQQRIARLLQLIAKNDQVTYLEVIVTRNTFSEFFDYYQQLQDVEARLHQALTQLRVFKEQLELQQTTLAAKKSQEEQFKATLEEQRQDLAERAQYQASLLKETERSEQKFASYVLELQAEQQQVNADIVDLERKIRQELERRKESERLTALGTPRMRWPTESRTVTTTFHDPDYPYRYIYEHPGLDLRAPQGSPVFAAESGYVAKVKDGGARGYSYLMLIHNDDLVTVYGHLSGFEVRADAFVTRGQVIARSGGAPGTKGAGRLTTGPHLHFEVRLKSIPVNPAEYLP